MNELKRKATKAFIWEFTGKLATFGTGFVVSIFLARLLQPSDFGLIAMVLAITGIAAIFSDLGLGSALIQRSSVLPIHYSSVFHFNITISLFLTLCTFLSAPLIANFYGNQTLVPLVQAVSFSFVINGSSTVHGIILRKELKIFLLTKARFLASLISGAIGITLAFYGAGVWSLVAQILSHGFIYNFIIWTTCCWKPSFKFSFNALMQLWEFGFRMFLSGLLDNIFQRLDSLIIGKLYTPAALGYYSQAKKLDHLVINVSSGSLTSILFPLLSKVQNDLHRFQNIIIKLLGLIIFINFYVLGGFYLVAHEIIIGLFGEKWLQSVDYFQILILSGFGYPISALLVNVLSSKGNSKSFLKLEIYKAIIFGLNLAVGFIWGIEGYLYGLVIATSLSVYLNIKFASTEAHIPIMAFIKPIVIQSTLTVILVFLILQSMHIVEVNDLIAFIIKISVFSILYLLLNHLLRTDSYQHFVDQSGPLLRRVHFRVKNVGKIN